MLMDYLLTLYDDLQKDPLGNADFSWFIGFFYLNGDKGKHCTGNAIASPLGFGEAVSIPIYELCFTLICTLAKDKTFNTYTDRRYAFRGVAHDFGKLWNQHGFLTSR